MSETSGAAGQGHDRYEQFVTLLVRHEPAVRSYLRSLLPAWHDVDEVTQETCLVLWKKFDQFDSADPHSNFRAWAFTIARLEALKYRRRAGRDRLMFGEELLGLLADEASAQAERREQERQALDQCLKELPGDRLRVLQVAYAGGSTIQEVAAGLGQSANSLYKALNRIRAQLLACVRRRLAVEEGSA